MSGDKKYFHITNWDEYQHYSDRNPPWIKLYNSILEDDDFVCLQDASKLLYTFLLLLASRTENEIRYDENYLNNVLPLNSKITKSDLKPLLEHGFIRMEHDASDVLADCNDDDSTETEGETETEEEGESEGGDGPAREEPDEPDEEHEVDDGEVQWLLDLWCEHQPHEPTDFERENQSTWAYDLLRKHETEPLEEAVKGMPQIYRFRDEGWTLEKLFDNFSEARGAYHSDNGDESESESKREPVYWS